MSARLEELERLEKASAEPICAICGRLASTCGNLAGASMAWRSARLAYADALRNAAPALLAIARAAEEADAHIFGNRDGMPEFDDWKWLTALQSALAALDGTPEGGGE